MQKITQGVSVSGKKKPAVNPSPRLVVLALAGLLCAQMAILASAADPAAKDPGVRQGAAGAGDALGDITAAEREYFDAGKVEFEEAEDVDEGLGPRMNLDSCGGCH